MVNPTQPVPSNQAVINTVFESLRSHWRGVSPSLGRSQEDARSIVSRASYGFLSELEPVLEGLSLDKSKSRFHRELAKELYTDTLTTAINNVQLAVGFIKSCTTHYTTAINSARSREECPPLARNAVLQCAQRVRDISGALTSLEEIRMHWEKLPDIDANGRNIIIAGLPNTGKTSILNQLTPHQHPAEPYAFTTKTLAAEDYDFAYQRHKVIDTPAVLSHAPSERTTIENMAWIAITHAKGAVLYVIDISDTCGYTLQQQCDALDQVVDARPDSAVIVVLNKTDLRTRHELDPDDAAILDALSSRGIEIREVSAVSGDNVRDVVHHACKLVKAERADRKLKGTERSSPVEGSASSQPQPRLEPYQEEDIDAGLVSALTSVVEQSGTPPATSSYQNSSDPIPPASYESDSLVLSVGTAGDSSVQHRDYSHSDGPTHSEIEAYMKNEPPPASHLQMILLTISLAGCQFAWGIQIGYSTKTLLELGMPATFVSYAWLAGPLSGMIVQPIVGVYSDACTLRLGRRRPFLIGGWVCILLSLAMFSNADVLGELCGDPSTGYRPRALVFAVIGFWVLDFSVNTVQGPARTLLADIVPTSQQSLGNTYFGFMTALGNASASFIGSLSLAEGMPFFKTDVRALYTIGAVVVTLTVGLTVFFIREKPLEPSQTRDTSLITLFRRARALSYPAPFKHAFTVQCLCWIAWFTTFIFATEWVGTTVYRGDAHASDGTVGKARFDEGVRKGNLALALQAVVAMVFSPLLPFVLKFVGMKYTYFSSQLLMSLCLCATLLVSMGAGASPPTGTVIFGALVIFAFLGITWAVTMTVPWAIVGMVLRDSPDIGLYMSIMNLSQAAPEILASFTGSLLIYLFKDSTAVLFFGGISAALSAFFVLYFKIDINSKAYAELVHSSDQQPLIADSESQEQAASIPVPSTRSNGTYGSLEN